MAARSFAAVVAIAALAAASPAAGPSAHLAAADDPSDLAVTVVSAPVEAKVGQDIVVVFRITNGGAGAAPATAVTVRVSGSGVDPAQAVALESAGSAQVPCTSQSYPPNSAACTTPPLAPGAAVDLPVTGRSANIRYAPRLNVAAAVSVAGDGNPANDAAQATTTIRPIVTDFAVSLSATPNQPTMGQEITYSLVVRNNGPDAGTEYASIAFNGGPPVAMSPAGVTLSAGQSRTVTYLRRADAPTIMAVAGVSFLPNDSWVPANQIDPDSANNFATVQTVVTSGPPSQPASADVGVEARATPSTLAVGGTVTLTGMVTNHGPGFAPGVRLTTPLPKALGFVSAASTRGSCSGTTTVVCEIGSLASATTGSPSASGDSATVTIVARAAAAGTYAITPTVEAAAPDPNVQANNHPTVMVTVTPSDATAPSVRAFAASGRHDRPVRLRFSVWDDSGRADVRWQVTGHGRVIAVGRAWLRSSRTPYVVSRRLAAGTYRLIVRAIDAAGNESAASSALVRVR